MLAVGRRMIRWVTKFTTQRSYSVQLHLPEEKELPRTSPLYQLAEYRPVAELKPMIVSLLDAKQLSTANTLLHQLQQRRPLEFRQLMTVDMLNRLIEAHLRQGEVEVALGWTERHPQIHDPLTFAIWLGYWIDQPGERKQVDRWLERMQPIKPAMIMATNYLSLRQLAILRSIDKHWEWSVDQTSSLFDISMLFEGENVTMHTAVKPDETVRQMHTTLGGAALIRDSLKALRETHLDPLIMQERLERDCYRASQDRLEKSLDLYRAATGTGDIGPLMPWIQRWHKSLVAEYQKMIADGQPLGDDQMPAVNPQFGSEHRQTTCNTMYASLLTSLKTDTIALIVLQELTKLPPSPTADDSSLFGIPLCRMAMNVGQAMEREVFAHQISQHKFLNQVRGTSQYVIQTALKDPRQLDGIMGRVSRELEQNIDAIKAGWIPMWTTSLRAEVGVYLIHGAIRQLYIEDYAKR